MERKRRKKIICKISRSRWLKYQASKNDDGCVYYHYGLNSCHYMLYSKIKSKRNELPCKTVKNRPVIRPGMTSQSVNPNVV